MFFTCVVLAVLEFAHPCLLSAEKKAYIQHEGVSLCRFRCSVGVGLVTSWLQILSVDMLG